MKPQIKSKIVDPVKYIFPQVWIWVWICMIIMISTSCISENYEPTIPDREITLNLRLNTSPLPTRTNDPSETTTENEGSDLEKYINPEDLWIAAYDADTRQRIEILYNIGETIESNIKEIDSEDKSSSKGYRESSRESRSESNGENRVAELSRSGTQFRYPGNSLSVTIKDPDIYPEKILIIAIANFNRFGISAEELQSASDLDNLCSLKFSLPSPNTPATSADGEGSIDYYPLPMYGSASLSLDTNSGQTDEICIDMYRALAKIEIADNLTESAKIESASLVKYSTEGNLSFFNLRDPQSTTATASGYSPATGSGLVFNKTTDSQGVAIFYAYVPETDLGDADSDLRKISLTLTDNKKSEIRLINYSEGAPSSQPSESWQTLKSNHIYRFNITGFTPSEPEIQIQPTIRICWYATGNGLFKANRIRFFKDNNDETGFVGLNNGIAITNYKIEFDEGIQFFYEDIEIDKNDLTLNDIQYSIFYNDDKYYDYIPELHNPLRRNLFKDIRKFQNSIINGKPTTVCCLNSRPVYLYFPITQSKYFKVNAKYRFYIRDNIDISDLELNAYINNRIDYQSLSFDRELKKDSNNNYYFFDFSVKKENIEKIAYYQPTLDTDYNNMIFGDMLLETIDGEDYYVFYAN